MISVGSNTIPRRRGIFELIYMDKPNKNNYNNKDLETYKEILEHTSVHRFQNNPTMKVKGNRGFKYIGIIKPLFDNPRKEIPPITAPPPPPQTSQLLKPATFQLPSYSEIEPSLDEDMSFQETAGEGLMKFNRNNTEYAYWDNPNELVRRLRLLRAETEAGHTNHGNEIQNIIEELTEAGYIYM